MYNGLRIIYIIKYVFGYWLKVCNKNKYYFLNSLKKIKIVNLFWF